MAEYNPGDGWDAVVGTEETEQEGNAGRAKL